MGKTLVKGAAVASSLILVGGLVSYRAGAFDSLVRPSQPVTEPATDRFAPAGEPVADDHQLIYGTKFGPIFVEESSSPTPSPAIMGGSKSRAVFDPPPPPDDPPQNSNTAEEATPAQRVQPPPVGNTKSTKRTTVMSSSKSIVLEAPLSPEEIVEILRNVPNDIDEFTPAPAAESPQR